MAHSKALATVRFYFSFNCLKINLNMTDCIFCKIINKKLPASVEAETKNVIVFHSIAPVSTYHVLIVPKKHIKSFQDFSPKDKDLFFEMVKIAQKVIKDKKLSSGYKLVINGGKYQAVSHFHWHLLGGELEDKNDILNQT